MLNPYVLLGGFVAAAAFFFGGVTTGIRWEEGRNAVENQHIAEAVDAANAASAEAIAKIKVTNKTIQNEVRREIETNTVYSDCRIPDNGVRLVNEAIAGTKPAAGGKLPGADTAQK